MDNLIWELMKGLSSKSFYISLYLISGILLPASTCTAVDSNTGKDRGDIRIMFYNTENTFDTFNDTLFNDEEFLPESERRWTSTRYFNKLTNIFKTIAAIGEEEPPEIICLAEIENKRVLINLIQNTPLEKYNFEIVHYDSPDQRGIDVAVLCRRELIHVIGSKYIRINSSDNAIGKTRDILYLKISTNKADTIHLFVNHWPSRRGGKKQSEGKRLFVAKRLKQQVDSLLSVDPFSKIIITGDFNDEPKDHSLTQALQAELPNENIQSKLLYNLSGKMQAECDCGTYRFRTSWNMLDQFIVSGSLLKKGSGLHTCTDCLNIANFSFLLREDKKYGGMKPFPTYLGPSYQGGFSDHLPIYLDLFY